MSEERNRFYKQSRYTYSGKQEVAVASSASAYNAGLEPTASESDVLELIGSYLFSLTLDDWVECKRGKSDRERKARLRAFVGDRYAYAIVQRNNEQLALQKRNIEQDRKFRELENKTYDKRIKQARKWREKHPDIVDGSGKKPTRKQYNPLTYEEWGRYRHNEAVLARYDSGEYIGVTFGGKGKQRVAVRAIQREPESLDAQAKHEEWKLSRYQIKAIGDSSHACGNSVIRVDADGVVRILVPEEIRGKAAELLGAPLVSGKYLVLEKPVVFAYGWDVLLASIEAGKSVTSSITHSNGSWKLTSIANSASSVNSLASKSASAGGSIASEQDKKQTFASGEVNPAIVARNAVREAKKELKKATVFSELDRSALCDGKSSLRFLGLDVNDGHIDVVICDVHGNPCGKPLTLPFRTDGTSAQIKSSVLHVLARIRHIVERRHVSCVFIESLNGFLDSKSKALNQGGRAFRRAVHRIPCGELRDWVVRKLTFEGCHVELVPAAYTSKCGEEFWSDMFESNHQAAALMIARRGLGLGLFRQKPTSPCQSCETGGECPSASLDNPVLGAVGGRARVGSDYGEEPAASAADSDICSAPALKGALLRTFRRSQCLSIPVDDWVPR